MKKYITTSASIILATLLLNAASHAAASIATSSNSRDLARKEFFKQVKIVRKEQPDIINPKRIILTAVEQMPAIPNHYKDETGQNPSITLFNDAPLRDFFGLSIQDLINHNLLPMLQHDAYGKSIWIEGIASSVKPYKFQIKLEPPHHKNF